MRGLQTAVAAIMLVIMVAGCHAQQMANTQAEKSPDAVKATQTMQENSLPTEAESPAEAITAAQKSSYKPMPAVRTEFIEAEVVEEYTAKAGQGPELPYTEEELEWLALVIYQEAGADACSDDTRLKVGTVVMNRVADDRFPGTIEEVLLQEAQYGRLHWTGLVWPERASTEEEAHAVERAYRCAERILMGERFLPADVIWQAEFTQGTEVVCEQEGFYFCR